MDEFDYQAFDSFAKIVVIGVGGGGSNAINCMIEERITNVDFWVCNTDAQALNSSLSPHKFLLGKSVTKGLGAGGDPSVGEKAAEDSLEEINEVIQGANIVFIAAGLGGGTGTGAAPVIAREAKKSGALTIAVVTRPFLFEGTKRKVNALNGLNKLKENVDAFIVVSNDKCMSINGSKGLTDGLKDVDKVLAQAVKTITDLITVPGIINLDFNDVSRILKDKGLAIIGFGEGQGEKKAIEAAQNAISSPLIESEIKGANAVIINIRLSKDTTMYDTNDVINYIQEASGSNADVIFGFQLDETLEDKILVSVIATDFKEDYVPQDIQIVRVDKQVSKDEVVDDEEEDILPSFMNVEEE